MKDVTITVAKTKEGVYRLIFNDDTVTASNDEDSKGNEDAFDLDSKAEVEEKIRQIIGNLE